MFWSLCLSNLLPLKILQFIQCRQDYYTTQLCTFSLSLMHAQKATSLPCLHCWKKKLGRGKRYNTGAACCVISRILVFLCCANMSIPNHQLAQATVLSSYITRRHGLEHFIVLLERIDLSRLKCRCQHLAVPCGSHGTNRVGSETVCWHVVCRIGQHLLNLIVCCENSTVRNRASF